MVRFRQTLQNLLRSIGRYETSSPTADGHICWKEATERSIELLTSNLSPLQRAQFRALGYFEVTGGDTGKRFRIRRGHQLNVEELDQKGRRLRLLCFMPEGHHPDGDVMLAQKMALELYESDALKIANRSPAWDDVVSGGLWVGRRCRHR